MHDCTMHLVPLCYNWVILHAILTSFCCEVPLDDRLALETYTKSQASQGPRQHATGVWAVSICHRKLGLERFDRPPGGSTLQMNM